MNKKVLVTTRLPQLQNLIKRDPPAYREEFLMQKRHFDSELEIFKLRPTKESDRFTELVTFMSHVASCYPNDCEEIPISLLQLLEMNATTLHFDVRMKLLQALILLRNKSMIDPLILLKLAFKLFSVPDKTLRGSLGEYIFNDIKSINATKRNEKLNRNVQAMLYGIVGEDTTIAARKTVLLLAELYRRRVWTDARTINVIASACTSSVTRVVVAALNFFLGIEVKMNEDEDEEKSSTVKEIDFHAHSKKTKSRIRHVQRQVEQNGKMRREQTRKAEESVPLFPAIQLIHDPQALAEKLFKKLRQPGEKFEVKLLLMNFISRLIGCHKLLLLSFYSFLQRYLTSHQQDVTHILAYLIQGCHDLVPPEELMPVVRAIAFNFITERCSNEVIAVGMNSVREIFSRVPAILREPDMGDFIEDLAQYSRKTHKSVMMAAHGIINLVRELYPTLLKKGDRGKFHDVTSVPVQYGDQRVSDGVEGAELLEAYERGDIIVDDDDVVWKSDLLPNDDDEMEEEEEEDDDDDDEEEEDDDDECPTLVQMDENAQEEDNDEEGDGDDEDDEDGEEEEMDADDDDEEGWISVGDDEEEEGDTAAKIPMVAPPPRDIRNRIDARRILTAEDFQLLERLKTAQAERSRDPKRRSGGGSGANSAMAKTEARKRAREEDNEDEYTGGTGMSFAVSADSLGAGTKTGKTSKLERIRHVLEGRKESKFEHNGHAGGTTNTEKLRKKNYVMVRRGKREVNNKIRKSNSDQRYDKMHAVRVIPFSSCNVFSFFVYHFFSLFFLILSNHSSNHSSPLGQCTVIFSLTERTNWQRTEKAKTDVILVCHFIFFVYLCSLLLKKHRMRKEQGSKLKTICLTYADGTSKEASTSSSRDTCTESPDSFDTAIVTLTGAPPSGIDAATAAGSANDTSPTALASMAAADAPLNAELMNDTRDLEPPLPAGGGGKGAPTRTWK